MKCVGTGLLFVTFALCQTDPLITVKPGPEVIKDKDLWEKTGIIHPFRRMPRYILNDQKAIWTSPFHTHKSDIKWWAIFGGATAAFIATGPLDREATSAIRTRRSQSRIGGPGSAPPTP